MISDEGYILRSINRHGHFGDNLHPASISTILKVLQKDLKVDSDEQPLRGGWQTDSTATKNLRNWIY
jgi:hypothetical protein